MHYRRRRHVTRRTVDLLTRNGRCRGVLRDISEGGARVDCRTRIGPAALVAVSIPGAEAEAEVRWIAEGRLGLQFLRDLLPETLDLMLAGGDTPVRTG